MPDTTRLSRREVLAGVAGTSVTTGAFTGGAVAAFTDSETASGSLTSGRWIDGCRAVFTDGSALSTVTQAGGVTTYGVDAVDVLGPVETGFDGSDYHVPIVDGNSDLELVAADGTRTALDVSGQKTARGKKAMLGTATWNGHPTSVYYPGGNESKLFRVEPGGKSKRVSKPSNGVKAALGAGDLRDDGTTEFCFVDGSATVRYIVPSGKNNERDIRTTGVSPGSNNNFGAGSPVAVDGYGVVIPAVNGSGAPGLLGPDGWVEKSLTSGTPAAKCPVHACDFDGDGAVELLFVGSADGTLRYVDDVGGSNDVKTVTDSSGDPIPADTTRGVR